jgi:hypothetical protein
LLLFSDSHETGCQHNSDDSTVYSTTMKTSIRVYILLFSCISSHTGLHYSRFSLLGVKLIYFRSVLVTLCCYTVFTRLVLFLLCCYCGLAFFFLADIIFHFCGVCVQRRLPLFLLLFDVTGVGVSRRLLPDISATAARYC